MNDRDIRRRILIGQRDSYVKRLMMQSKLNKNTIYE